ncbi:MAG TPA: glycogen debranching protein GlgX, partial [Flavitalea sp.]|nr:glycogen debranching protein GlgX [Flavitalea sp.]
IYEIHVKGFTRLQNKLPESIRGTYKALAHPDTIAYFKSLGITAVELMPVHHFVSDRHLFEKGLVNYWGYNTIGFFAPDIRYSSDKEAGAQVKEFKEMVKALHKAGLEVILDVVYNHTAEGNENGPTLSFKGIDNESYYRLCDNKMHYMDYTGTGNTFNARMPNVLRLIMDSLRYWVEEMHVDGFRFDLASALARELHEVDRLSAFFDIIHQDPVISQAKLIAEPWDVGEGGYQVGKFPPGWAEWNGMYRDCIRDFWRGADSMLGEFALRFTGSPDLYENDYRRPTASINFITAHDGYTLHDLVTYTQKHNEANQENNMDGDNHNRSENYGVEGPTNDIAINKLRARQKRNFFTTLFLSQGVPMILGGDEISRTQKGNNNAYCQDNEISWVDWNTPDNELRTYVQELIAFWKAHPAFSRHRWFQGKPIRGVGLEDIVWFLPDGSEMEDHNWQQDFAKSLGIFINGLGLGSVDEYGTKMTDDNFYLIFNAHDEPLNFVLPSQKYGHPWTKILDTYEGIFTNSNKNEAMINGDTIVSSALRDNGNRDEAAKTRSLKEETNKERPIKDGSHKITLVKDVAFSDVAVKDSSVKDVPVKDVPVKGVTVKDAAVKERPAKEEPVRQDAFHDAAGKEGTGNNAYSKEATIKKGSIQYKAKDVIKVEGRSIILLMHTQHV